MVTGVRGYQHVVEEASRPCVSKCSKVALSPHVVEGAREGVPGRRGDVGDSGHVRPRGRRALQKRTCH